MMKHENLLLIGLLSLALIFGMAVVGCDNGTTNSGDNDHGLPAPIGVNEVSGKTYYGYSKIDFSKTDEGATIGSYYLGASRMVENGKYVYTEEETGIYTWNEDEKTVILEPERIYLGTNETVFDLISKAELRPIIQAMYDEERAEMGEKAFTQFLLSIGFSSAAAAIDYELNEMFAKETYNYSFSTNGAALFLDEKLPVNKGTNELSGQTYYEGSREYVFTASGYTSTSYGETTIGAYSYDSSLKEVWFRPLTVNGLDRAAYYESVPVPGSHYDVDDNAYSASVTNGVFYSRQYSYDSTTKTIFHD